MLNKSRRPLGVFVLVEVLPDALPCFESHFLGHSKPCCGLLLWVEQIVDSLSWRRSTLRLLGCNASACYGYSSPDDTLSHEQSLDVWLQFRPADRLPRLLHNRSRCALKNVA